LLLNTASLSILCYEHDRADQRAIELWNSAPLERFAATDPPATSNARSTSPLAENAIQRWENEGGEIPPFLKDAGKEIP